MFAFHTFVLRNQSQIVEKYGLSSSYVFLKHPEFCFIDIHNASEMEKVRAQERHNRLYLAVTLEFKGEKLIDYDAYGMGIWSAYIEAAYQYISKGYGEVNFGIEPLLLSIKPGSSDAYIRVRLAYEEKVSNKEIFAFEAPSSAFIYSLAEAGRAYFTTMGQYGFKVDTASLERLDMILSGCWE